ncbi:shikimate dehydrogenase family protein [Mesobacterium pallidum]|uniref:shikimate dehydrogenase family protein n=1 Tax=Mesobacterium pallidum TaxID=2872037 RepID=UPI001EE2E26A|nr:shikimate dehydrogenase [Mesobacterium pallidum]
MTLALNGETQVVFIIGDPIAQVKSPALLTARFIARGVNAVCVPGHVSADKVDGFFARLDVLQNAPGVVITVPHKQAAMTFCDHLTARARHAHSVNVMRRTDTGWVGDNTDGQGYVQGIKAAGGTVADARVLLVGAGGAGAAIAYEFLAEGAAQLAIHEIDTARRDALIARLEPAFPGRLSIGSDDPTGFDIVANATPLGMRAGDPLPVQVNKLTAAQFAACPITKPTRSPFIEAAAAIGCQTMPGLGMFQAQEELLVEALLTLEAN